MEETTANDGAKTKRIGEVFMKHYFAKGSNKYSVKHKGLSKAAIHSIFKVSFTVIAIVALIQWYRYGTRLQYYHWRDTSVIAPCEGFCTAGLTVEAQEPIPTPTVDPKWSNVVKLITDEFESEGPQVVYQALSVGKNESGWRYNAQGWNCIYDGVSKACKKEDRENAWSVDCGVMQINVKGTECPKELFDIKYNVKKAHEMYKNRLWSPWVAARSLGYVN